jgi:hypothetical protein
MTNAEMKTIMVKSGVSTELAEKISDKYRDSLKKLTMSRKTRSEIEERILTSRFQKCECNKTLHSVSKHSERL